MLRLSTGVIKTLQNRLNGAKTNKDESTPSSQLQTRFSARKLDFKLLFQFP